MKKKKKKILIIVLVLLLIIGIGVGSYFIFFKKPIDANQPANEVKVMNEISNYGYSLDDRDTELFKQTFNRLEETLNSESINNEEYASLVAQLFIIDLYTIDNKISKYDIGGLEYVYSEAVDSFKSVVMDTIYKTVINNLDKKRNQTLPEVTSIEVKSIKESTYKMVDGNSLPSYTVSLSWEYAKNLGYDTEGVVTLIVNNDRIDVVAFEPND